MLSIEELRQFNLNRSAVIAGHFSKETSNVVPQVSSDTIQKAIESGEYEVYEENAVNAFVSKIRKAHMDGGLRKDELEKAKRDLSKLTKVQKVDKNGDKRFVWVKTSDKKESAKETKESGENKDNSHVKKAERALKEEYDKISADFSSKKITEDQYDKKLGSFEKRAETKFVEAFLNDGLSEVQAERAATGKVRTMYEAFDKMGKNEKPKQTKKESAPKSPDVGLEHRNTKAVLGKTPDSAKEKTGGYKSETKTKAEGEEVIKRMTSALKNPKTPAGMKARAGVAIKAEKEKWKISGASEGEKKVVAGTQGAEISSLYKKINAAGNEKDFHDVVSRHYNAPDDGETVKETLANLAKLPADKQSKIVEGLKKIKLDAPASPAKKEEEKPKHFKIQAEYEELSGKASKKKLAATLTNDPEEKKKLLKEHEVLADQASDKNREYRYALEAYNKERDEKKGKGDKDIEKAEDALAFLLN